MYDSLHCLLCEKAADIEIYFAGWLCGLNECLPYTFYTQWIYGVFRLFRPFFTEKEVTNERTRLEAWKSEQEAENKNEENKEKKKAGWLEGRTYDEKKGRR